MKYVINFEISICEIVTNLVTLFKKSFVKNDKESSSFVQWLPTGRDLLKIGSFYFVTILC